MRINKAASFRRLGLRRWQLDDLVVPAEDAVHAYRALDQRLTLLETLIRHRCGEVALIRRTNPTSTSTSTSTSIGHPQIQRGRRRTRIARSGALSDRLHIGVRPHIQRLILTGIIHRRCLLLRHVYLQKGG
ncbi:hypothetical protein [Castellaniella sp.]|uniref:hypothetical protein n=1 Tax=Castellaniella sp. TaxID=1955812 RepID=UPI003A8EAEA1